MAGNGKILRVADLISDALDETGAARALRTVFAKGAARGVIIVHDRALAERVHKDIRRAIDLPLKPYKLIVNADAVPPGGVLVGDFDEMDRQIIAKHYKAQRRTGTP